MNQTEKRKKLAAKYQEVISCRLAYFRKEKNISSVKMSLALGKSQDYISKIERKKFLPSIKMFLRICSFLDIKPKDFFDDGQ